MMPSSEISRSVGLIAGQGDLPQKLLAALKAQGHSVFVLGFKGQFKAGDYADTDYGVVGLGQIGKGINLLKSHGVTHLVLGGGIKRPSLFHLKLDRRGGQILKKIGFQSLGDDKLLTILMEELEKEGFTILKTSDILKNISTKSGVLTTAQPLGHHQVDIEVGRHALEAMSSLDIGQAVVVQQGIIIGVEAVEGTDGLIGRYKALKKEGAAGVLVKLKKKGQDERADMPTIGVETVRQAAQSGLAGIAVSAGSTQILDQEKVIQAADDAGLFLVAVLS